jgi:type I restriction-modification system DNA methylase subunit
MGSVPNIFLKNGGFDVIIGNPPYVEYKNIKGTYRIRHLVTESCGDLYSFIMERSTQLLSKVSRLGMIVPVSIVSTDGFAPLRSLLFEPNRISWNLNFAERPSKLFVGVEKRLTIWIMHQGASSESVNLSKYKRWFAEERLFLFSQGSFIRSVDDYNFVGSATPKINSIAEIGILTRLSKENPLKTYFSYKSKNIAYYTRKLRYFVQFFDFIPEIKDSKGKKIEPSELKMIYFDSNIHRDVVIAILNSNLFFWFFSKDFAESPVGLPRG